MFFGKNSAIDYMESNCEHWHQLAYWFAVQNIKLPLNRVFPIKNMDQKRNSLHGQGDFSDADATGKQYQLCKRAVCEEIVRSFGNSQLFSIETKRKIRRNYFIYQCEYRKSLNFERRCLSVSLLRKTLKSYFPHFHEMCPKSLSTIPNSTTYVFYFPPHRSPYKNLPKNALTLPQATLQTPLKKFGCTPTEYRLKHTNGTQISVPKKIRRGG
ncbi:MAG: hypothetical protein ACLRSW_01165 [Christensenellaceae bacterium]